MLVFDQLRKDDPQLRLIALATLTGLLVLLGGLWWVQVVSTRYYNEKLENQSIRTVRLPAVRGRILDRNGRALAENRPSYNIAIYLEELSTNYQAAFNTRIAQVRDGLNQQAKAKSKELHRDLTPAEKRAFAISKSMREQLSREVRYQVTSNIVADLSARLHLPLSLSQTNFERHYGTARALPLDILTNLTPAQLALFEEESPLHTPAMDLDIQSIRAYPYGTTAAHLLGYLVHDIEPGEGEARSAYSYKLDDYKGVSGIEKLFDKELRGTAGAKSVLVNYLGYREGETIWSPASSGENVSLTLDYEVQQAADKALDAVRENIHGAVVVMDVRSGDILAMASSPTYYPSNFVQRPAPDAWSREWERWNDKDMEVQLNHAAQGWYAPGSVFKIVVSMAGLELGTLHPDEVFHSPGYAQVGSRIIHDTAKHGQPADFKFKDAFAESSNAYFVTNGLKPGVLQKMIELGKKLHFGERPGALDPAQEDRALFPGLKEVSARSWRDGDTANLSIGQSKLAVTPLQVAVMVSAVANGGSVLYPRLVSSVKANGAEQPSAVYPGGRVKDNIGVSKRTLQLVREAMREDVQNPEGTGKGAEVEGFPIAGKTGTAEVEKNGHVDRNFKITWFASFGPYDNPRYAVVVMVVSGASGGLTCAPIANEVYKAIQNSEKRARGGSLATVTAP